MKTRLAATAFLLLLSPFVARAGEPVSLRQFSGALSQLADKVSPAVVQIVVSGYGPSAADDLRTDAALVARRRAIGSGVIVDPAGYIVTNAHVVQGAQRIQVLLPKAGSARAQREAVKKGVFKARLVGIHQESDLAVLKIDAQGLPALALRDAPVQQGELVFAVGSPQGLASSMTMGIVSAPAREPEPDVPLLYIQTDAPINPGNSGGPLVNADGEVVGINTFILSKSGGSDGLGFAIPARVVSFVYQGLRKNGGLQRIELGITGQGISPDLADGLGLERDWGVVISDVVPRGPGDVAGLQRRDIVDMVDGRPVDNAAGLMAALYRHTGGRPVEIVVLRGRERLTVRVLATERTDPMAGIADAADPDEALVGRLGVLAVPVDRKIQQVAGLREPGGLLIVARTLDATSVDSGLVPGDVIHALNRAAIDSIGGLRHAIDARKPGDAVVLEIERFGRFQYLHFEME